MKPQIDHRIDDTITEGRGILTGVAVNIDIIGGVIGLILTLTAITLLASWVWAMGAGGLALIALATVVPTWDS